MVQPKIHKSIKHLFIEKEDGGIHIQIPSGQAWNKLSPKRRVQWRVLIAELGYEPEDYLDMMRANLPKGSPK